MTCELIIVCVEVLILVFVYYDVIVCVAHGEWLYFSCFLFFVLGIDGLSRCDGHYNDGQYARYHDISKHKKCLIYYLISVDDVLCFFVFGVLCHDDRVN